MPEKLLNPDLKYLYKNIHGCWALVLPRYCCTLLYYKKEIEEHSTAKFVFPRVRACNKLVSILGSTLSPILAIKRESTRTELTNCFYCFCLNLLQAYKGEREIPRIQQPQEGMYNEHFVI